MFDLVRLIYTSRANFVSNADSPMIESEVAEILKQSRVKNRDDKIGGVLYFADGYFFQCLEGRKNTVLSLVKKLENDPRHTDLKVSFYRRARRRRFRDWSMKYISVNEDVINLVKSRGYESFDPVSFMESDINSLIDLFTRLEDVSLKDPELRKAHLAKPSLLQRVFASSAVRAV